MPEITGKVRRKTGIKKLIFFYSGLVSTFLLDRITKIAVISNIPENSSIVIFRFFYITNIRNSGICFGLFDNLIYLPFFIFTSIAALGIIIVYIHRKKTVLSAFPCFCFGLIGGGILGNLIDRVFHRGVIDFIDFRVWPVFNLADAFIVCGIAFLVFFYSRRENVSCLF